MKIDDIKSGYAEKINNDIKKYKNIILDSFVEYYGEGYRKVITERFNDTCFLYYINDITIFYILDSIKNEDEDKVKDAMFAIPYIIHLIKNNLYKREITADNFYELGLNKIVGVSDNQMLLDKELLKYCIGLALRENNENIYAFNMPINKNIKRIIALPIFCVNDKAFFHDLNHAICSELIIVDGEETIKCGLDYSNRDKKYAYEIINDMVSLEIYNIFKQKCSDNIFDDDIMSDVLLPVYENYHYLARDFYEKNKEAIKASIIDHSNFCIGEEELNFLFSSVEKHIKKKTF